MGLADRIKDLADSKKVTFAEIERVVGISNGQIRRWNTVSPKTENVQLVADYFNVSVDYLLGRTSDPNIARDMDTDVLVAAHMTDGLSEDELKEVQQYIEFLKSKHG